MRTTAFVCLLGLGLMAAAPTPSRAQIAVGGQLGTTGIGGMVAMGLSPQVVFRGSVSVFPIEPEFELDGINYTTEFPTPQIMVTADWHPGATAFYFSGGLHSISDGFKVTAAPTEPVQIGDDTYQPDDVGTLIGTLSGRDISPYLGIGLGNPLGDDREIGFQFDLGVSFIGDPDIQLDHEGGNLSPTEEEVLDANLRVEADRAEDDAIGIYPVINLGLSIKVGGR